jgi:glutamyl endopeptidase
MLELPQSPLRDIGELSFGRREPPVLEAQPEAALLALPTMGQRQRVSAQAIAHTPWRKICDLLITANDGTQHTGTAWFISPRTLVTAGHCMFVHNPGAPVHGMIRKVMVMPARNGESAVEQSPFGWAEVPRDNLSVHSRWKSGDINFDYGVIVLPDNFPGIGAQTGWFGYGHYEDGDLDESTPTLSGYPDDVPDGTQWFEVNLIKQVNPRRVFYSIHTVAGQSGSPVFFRDDDGDIACAIHNWGDDSLNSGVRINPEVIAQLNAWKID